MAYGVTLVDMKKVVNDYIAPLIDLLTDAGALLRVLPFDNIDEGFDPKIPTISGASQIAFRDLDTSYTEAAHGLGSVTEKIRPFGRILNYDPAMSAQGLASKASRIQRAYARRMGLMYIDMFVNGDVNGAGHLAYGFDGIKARCEANGGARQLAAGANGGYLSITLLDDLVDAVAGGANILIGNRRAHAWLKTLAQAQTHKFRFDWTNIPGLEGRVIALDGSVPFLPIWENADGDPVIPNDEEEGEADDCTSIYALKLGQDLVHGLQGKANDGGEFGLYLGPIEKVSGARVLAQEFEWVAGLGIPDPTFIYRLKGLNGVDTTAPVAPEET